MMINPILESSARRRMRTGRTAVILTMYMAVLLLFSVVQLSVFFGKGLTIGQMRLSTEWYIWLTALQLALIVLTAPALSAVSIAGERERQTFDLLLVTGVGAGRIVTGKLLENFAFMVLMILCGMPVMTLAYVTSGVTMAQLMATAAFLIIIALEALSVGMLASVIARRALTAIIVSYLGIFVLGSGTWLMAKHGPLAASYTYKEIAAFAQMNTGEILRSMPVTIFFNPAVGLVMLLAHQTGILHNTMQNTMRLFDIYSAAKAAGFGAVSGVCFAACCGGAAVLMVLSAVLLHAKTGAKRK